MNNILLSALNNTFELFGREIHWYGVILTSGMIMAFLLFLMLAKKDTVKEGNYFSKQDGLDSDFSLTLFLCAIIGAIIGARATYVLSRAGEYFASFDDFLRAFNISEGGLTILGGVPGGAIGVIIACKIYKKSFFRVADMIVPCLLLGQVIGRWGNFINQELYGLEITNPTFQKFPFAVYIDGSGWHCANFFYESFFNFIAFIIALVIILKYKDKLKVGTLSACYVLWYCILRGCLEFVKVDGQLWWGNIRVAQFFCFLIAPFVLVLIVLIQTGKIKLETSKMYDLHYKIKHEPPAYIEEVAEEVIENNSIDDITENTDND